MSANIKPNEVTVIPAAETPLRKTVGADFSMAATVTAEKVNAAQALINEANLEFFVDSEPVLLTLEALADAMTNETAAASLKEAEPLVYSIKSQAGILGFGFISELCSQLIAVLNSSKLSDEKRHRVYVQLVKALRLAYDLKITNAGDKTAVEILKQLGLTQK